MINVNTASKAVLSCLPMLDETDADALIAQRSAEGVDLTNMAWVTQALPQAKVIDIGGSITAKCYQYTADIIAVSGDGRAFKRYRAIIDTRQTRPAIMYWKDMTYLGWPLDPSILTNLRNGTGVMTVSMASAKEKAG